MKHSSKTTTDHGVIREWVESRGGKPAMVKATERGETGMLRILFDEDSKDSLEEVSWDDFFNTFEKSNLAFLYQEETKDGETSRFFKFVDRDSVDEDSDEEGEDESEEDEE